MLKKSKNYKMCVEKLKNFEMSKGWSELRNSGNVVKWWKSRKMVNKIGKKKYGAVFGKCWKKS